MRSHSQALNSNDVFDDNYHHKKMDWALLLWRELEERSRKSLISHNASIARAEIGVRTWRLQCMEASLSSCGPQEMFPFPWGRNHTELTSTMGNWHGRNIDNKYRSNCTMCFSIILSSSRRSTNKGKKVNNAINICVAVELYSLFTWIVSHLPIALWVSNYHLHFIGKNTEAQRKELNPAFDKIMGLWNIGSRRHLRNDLVGTLVQISLI